MRSAACRARARERRRARLEHFRTVDREYQRRRVLIHGLCATCGEPQKGDDQRHWNCTPCRLKRAAYARDRRARGLMKHPSGPNPRTPEARAAQIRRGNERRALLRSLGRCTDCKLGKLERSKHYCQACLDKRALKSRKARAKRLELRLFRLEFVQDRAELEVGHLVGVEETRVPVALAQVLGEPDGDRQEPDGLRGAGDRDRDGRGHELERVAELHSAGGVGGRGR